MLVALFAVYVVASLVYIHRLHNRLRGYELVWEQIEQVADRNEDGTFNINIQHMEDAHPVNTEAHLNADNSGVHLVELDEELENRTDDGPPRAA